MTKILSVILIILALSGIVYFSKNHKTENLTAGSPIGSVFSQPPSKQTLQITFPGNGISVNAKYDVTWTGSAQKSVKTYYIYLINASSTKQIFLGTAPSSQNKLNFKVSEADTQNIIEGWKIIMLDKSIDAKPSLLATTQNFIIATSNQGSTHFYAVKTAPATIPVEYIISVSRDSARPKSSPKVRINCPTGVAVLLPGTSSDNQCGKEFATVMLPEKENGFVYVYVLRLSFTNINPTTQIASAEATVDGNVISYTELEVPSTNSEPFVPKG